VSGSPVEKTGYIGGKEFCNPMNRDEFTKLHPSKRIDFSMCLDVCVGAMKNTNKVSKEEKAKRKE